MRSFRCSIPAQLTISEQTSPAPKRRPWRRNACTLTPAIGARTRRVGISTSRMRQLSRRSIDIGLRMVLTGIDRVRGGSYHSRPRRRVIAGFLALLTGRNGLKEVILTPEGYEKLKVEIEHLSTNKRREVADRIRVAREFGDISENAEYDDAKNEQAMLEHKIAQLEERLSNARVIQKRDVDLSVVSIGAKVKLRDVDAKATVEYTIVGSAEANPTESKLSNESPVGKAIIGKKKGETVEVVAPRGSLKYKILDIQAA